MPRTLPWLVGSTKSRSHEAQRERYAKRRELVNEVLEDGIASPPRRLRTHNDRTPSTSPPPAPPEQEFMHEGLDKDDMYIMVEDEFHATAKTFTQHLHHAEYVRLKRLAEEKNAATAYPILRPVDPRVVMSEELKGQKAARARAKNQKQTVDERSTRMGKGSEEQGEEDSDSQSDEERDPWTGTSLQSLMTASKHAHHSLRGLSEVRSRTRAASGFASSRGETRSSRETSWKLSRSAPPDIALEDGTTASEDDDNDDLDAPIIRPNAGKASSTLKPGEALTHRRSCITEHPTTESSPELHEMRDVSPPQPLPGVSASTKEAEESWRAKVRRKTPCRALFDGDNNDDLDPVLNLARRQNGRLGSLSSSRCVKVSNEQIGNEEGMEKIGPSAAKSTSLGEIPTFLY